MPSSLDKLIAAAEVFLKVQRPGDSLTRIEIHSGGDPEPIRVALASLPPGSLNETEATILEALGDDCLTGRQISRRSGYAYSSHLRATLANMRRRGLLTHGDGAYGYRAAPEITPPRGRRNSLPLIRNPFLYAMLDTSDNLS